MSKLFTPKALAVVSVMVALAAAGRVGSVHAAEDEEASTVTSVFRVEGMTCGGCEAGVKAKVKQLVGVREVDASYREGRATVTYEADKVTPERIIAAIEELGYSAELTKENAGEPAPYTKVAQLATSAGRVIVY